MKCHSGSPEAFSGRLTTSQVALTHRALLVNCFAFRTVERNSGGSLFSVLSLATSRWTRMSRCYFSRTGISRLLCLFVEPQNVLLAVTLELLEPRVAAATDRPTVIPVRLELQRDKLAFVSAAGNGGERNGHRNDTPTRRLIGPWSAVNVGPQNYRRQEVRKNPSLHRTS